MRSGVKIFLVLAVFSLVAGAIAGFYFGQQSVTASGSVVGSEADFGALRHERDRLRQQLRDSDRALAASQVELSRLRNENLQLRLQDNGASADWEMDSNVSPENEDGDGDQMERRERWESMRAERRAAFARQQVRGLANRLGLSAEQQDALIEILQEQPFGRRGGMGGADTSSILAEWMAEELDDDQYERWQAYRDEEVRVRAETFANVELGRMSLMLGLEEHQKDAVFVILYQQAVELNQGSTEGLRMNIDQRVDQLRGILDPNQLEAYENSLQGFRGN